MSRVLGVGNQKRTSLSSTARVERRKERKTRTPLSSQEAVGHKSCRKEGKSVQPRNGNHFWGSALSKMKSRSGEREEGSRARAYQGPKPSPEEPIPRKKTTPGGACRRAERRKRGKSTWSARQKKRPNDKEELVSLSIPGEEGRAFYADHLDRRCLKKRGDFTREKTYYSLGTANAYS